jgi:peptidoglycan/xylan/chitin deacetylase (PgdA/CDA1 family)
MHRNRLARRLAMTKFGFMVGWLAILVALLGAGQVVDAIPERPAPVAEVRPVLTPAPPVDADLVSALAAIPPAGRDEPPLMLTYHEISPTENSPYTLTPEAFAEQMRMLADAGYRTIRAADVAAWMAGAPLPPKSMLLTFDDGTTGVWRYADPILARHGFSATAFIITSYPGRGPRYLTWSQISELARSGRWDIQSHTRAGHRNVPISDSGTEGAFLTNRAWIHGERRRESFAEYRRRVTADLEGSVLDLRAQGLPRPVLFSFPFSAATSDEPRITRFLTGLTNRLFAASMLDDGVGGVTSPVERARHQLRRLNALRRSGPARVVAEIIRASPLPDGGTYALAVPGAWEARSRVGSMRVDRTAVRIRVPARRWASIEYRPTRTAFWRDYSVATTVTGLGPGASAGVSLWTGGPRQLTVSVSAGWLQVSSGLPGRTVHEGRLADRGRRHSLVVSVARGRLTVVVDGVTVVRDRGVARGTGGVALFGSTRARAATVEFTRGRVGPPR